MTTRAAAKVARFNNCYELQSNPCCRNVTRQRNAAMFVEVKSTKQRAHNVWL